MQQVYRDCKRKEPEGTSTAEIGNTVKANKAHIAAPHPRVLQLTPPAIKPESFPKPVIGHAWKGPLLVRVNGELVVQEVLAISTGSFYEIELTLNKAIYGEVIRVMVIEPSPGNTAGNNGPNDTFVRTDVQRAIKVYCNEKLKALRGTTAEDPMMEIAALQFIGDSHPNIMGQIECCVDQDDNIYSVMRFVPGGELFDFIDERGPLEVPLARSMTTQVLGALDVLHERGIGHRDMSLENVLFDGDDHFEVIDFGMCLRLERDHATGRFRKPVQQSICGKRNYIAPEMIRRDASYDPRLCDIWAVGVMLFIALTGVPPVASATNNCGCFRMICDGRLREMVGGWGVQVDAQALDLIQQILRPNPQDRPTIAQILAHPWFHADEPAPTL